MNIFLRKLALKNFKGIKELEIDFSNVTNIYGENATGKTTVFDGFCWLLFGKDSKGRSSFEIQPLDESNNVLHGLDTVVSAVMEIDGVDKEFVRKLSEKWVKQRGQAEAELKGTTTTYEINGVPVKQKEYLAEISSIINEDLFKMVTNPLYFPTLKWQEQRKILLDIIGDIEDVNVISYNDKLSKLNGLLNDGIDNFNKKTKASISKLKEQVKSIPYRIDECNNSIVEVDVEELEADKKNKELAINNIDEQIADSSKANEEKLRLQEQLYSLKEKENKLKLEATTANKPLLEVKDKIVYINSKLKSIIKNKSEVSVDLDFYNKEKSKKLEMISFKEQCQQELRDKWAEVSKREFEFNENDTICPCCGRAYEMDKIEEIKQNALENFNKLKESELKEIQIKGKAFGKDIETIKLDIKKIDKSAFEIGEKATWIDKEINELKTELDSLQHQEKELSEHKEVNIPGIEEIQAEIESIQAEMANFNSNDNSELKNKKLLLRNEIEAINRQLASKENNKKLLERIDKLKEEEKELNVKIAKLEELQFLGEEFIRTKVELLEGSINKKFNGAVAFKLFNQQVNGGLSECCEALVDGVPFGNVNTAGQINAGLSIIKTLSEHYDVQAPIFIDNRESVNQLVNLNNQVINLVVSKDKKMKVEVEE